ncbi:LacI family DNA-binding transcriptional regulator [Microbacterium sp. KSW-18]|uniref:LacI family DNA-binding transcriptional regulator n=1 Tax=Microbacterium aquilitoris TaxID=3067307 RepID=A0ABU3GIW8_9MICO|nr:MULTISPECIES: LacI family DNA-binding transcriptional regulator [unclassified Microbacterium]MDT3329851.1 LacI family DNA-binding transcriptional regulator [Microbacterium sp. KSW-18]
MTLADVARAAGVSRTTASLVLSGRGDEMRIAEASQERVRLVAAELGYRPNMISAGLRSGTSRTLGFISDSVATSQLAGDMIKGALEGARRHGHMLFIGEYEGDDTERERLIDAMLDRQVDGVILASMFTRERPVPAALAGRNVVLLNTLPEGPAKNAHAILPDELDAGRRAARLLLERGHRDIHLIGAGPTPADVPRSTIAGRERLEGILDELTGAGLSPASGRKLSIWLPADGWKATADLIASGVRSGAIIAFNDRIAFGAYQAVSEAGLTVPGDFSIVSFDDHQLASWVHPGLTTFAIPHFDLGLRAVEMLLTTPAESPASVERLPMPLRSRGSVRAVTDAH